MVLNTPQQGSNAERSRHRNRRAVLGQIHNAGQMGRAEIARVLSLSTQAVSNIIAELEGDGLLIEKGRLSAGRGLPAVQYSVNPTGGYALGIEVRADAVLAVLVDLHGKVLTTVRRKLTDTRPDAVLKKVVKMRDAALDEAPEARNRLLGAGVVMPGPVGATGIAGLGTDLTDWQEVDARALFTDALGLATEVSNDANAAAMAEQITGVAQGLSTYAYLYFGTGLGLGYVSGGQLVAGAFGNAGEIGHIPIAEDGQTLENAISRLSVQRYLRKRGKSVEDVAALAKLFDADDRDLMVWLQDACIALGRAVAIVENLLDPRTIILGGAMPNTILDYLVAHTPLPSVSVANRPTRDNPRLMRGASGRLTATLGAAALVLNKTLSPQFATAI